MGRYTARFEHHPDGEHADFVRTKSMVESLDTHASISPTVPATLYAQSGMGLTRIEGNATISILMDCGCRLRRRMASTPPVAFTSEASAGASRCCQR